MLTFNTSLNFRVCKSKVNLLLVKCKRCLQLVNHSIVQSIIMYKTIPVLESREQLLIKYLIANRCQRILRDQGVPLTCKL